MLLRLNNTLCSIGATKTLALSFYPLKDFYRERMAVVPPLLREEVLQTTPEDKGYILGYMLNPGYADEVKEWLNPIRSGGSLLLGQENCSSGFSGKRSFNFPPD